MAEEDSGRDGDRSTGAGRWRSALVAATLVYAGLTSLGAWGVRGIDVTEPPMGLFPFLFVTLHHVGALVWLAIWLGSGLAAWRSGPRPAGGDIVAVLTAIALTGLVGTLVGDMVPFLPKLWGLPYIASFALFGVLPGLRGGLWGVSLAERLPARGAGAEARAVIVASGILVGATAAWWPMALATMITAAVNGTTPLDANECATLGAAIAAAVITAVVVVLRLARAPLSSQP